MIGLSAGFGLGIALSTTGTGQATSRADPAHAFEPYEPLSGGGFTGPSVAASPDPLVAYRWASVKATGELQSYARSPKAVSTDTPASFAKLGSATSSSCDVTVTGTGSIQLDFGVESPAWLEFDSPDLAGSVRMSVSEYDRPAVVNPGVAHPVKTAMPVAHGTTYRLELNADLYEGVRFGWIHVDSFSTPWHITAIRAVCQVKPVNYDGSFDCDDDELNRIWYSGAYGVRAGFQRDYMAPILMDRGDRFGWAGDCNPIQSAALVAFGNYDYVKANLSRTKESDFGIVSYSLLWVLSMLEYYRFSGDSAEFAARVDDVTAKLDHAETIYAEPPIHFYGWDERLGGGFIDPDLDEPRNCYRMLHIRSCREFADAVATIGRSDLAAKYRLLAQRHDDDLHANPLWYRTFGVHARSEAANAGCVRPGEVAAVLRGEFTDRLTRLSFSTFNQFYILQGMANLGAHDDAIQTMRDNWGGQLRYGGTMFFEVFRPDWLDVRHTCAPPPNSESGWTSMAHPWGGGATAWLTREILGIRATAPGFTRFDVAPLPGTTPIRVRGSVPTPKGVAAVDYDTRTGRGSVTVPAGTTARVFVPAAGRRIAVVRLDGTTVWSGGKATTGQSSAGPNGTVVLPGLTAGRHRLEVTYSGPRAPITPAAPIGYPLGLVRTDTTTSGDWRGVYGRNGYVLLDYVAAGTDQVSLPGFVTAVRRVTTRAGSSGVNGWNDPRDTQWAASTTDPRALAPPDGTTGRVAACVYSNTPDAGGMTFALDVHGAPPRPYNLSLYFVDWDSTAREVCIELFDLTTLKLLAPVHIVSSFHQGTYLTFRCDRAVRLRFAHVSGANAVVSGVFFDPA